MAAKLVRLFVALLFVTSGAQAQSLVIASNYVESGPAITRSFDKDLWWAVDTVALHDGYISEVGVYMGLNQVPYDATLVINVNGHQLFAEAYKGLKQRRTDWATVFPVTTAVPVKHGDTITITISPRVSVNVVPATKANPSQWAGPVSGPYAKMIFRCFINGTMWPPPAK